VHNVELLQVTQPGEQAVPLVVFKASLLCMKELSCIVVRDFALSLFHCDLPEFLALE